MSLLSLFIFLFSAFQLDFEGSDIETHIEQKLLYYRQFSDLEKFDFCQKGETLSCKILFLNSLNSKESNDEKSVQLLDLIPENEREVGLYFYVSKKWNKIPIDKLKSYIALLPEDLATNLYSIYLKKLYLMGNIQQFMADYRQEKNGELTKYYVSELLKQDPEKGLHYLRNLKINFSESFYDSISKVVENYSKKLSAKAYNEFKIWSLEFNYRKIRYKETIKMAEAWFPSKKYDNAYSWRANLYRAMSHTKRREHLLAEAIYKKLDEHCLNEDLNSGDIYKFFAEYAYSEAALGNNEKTIELYLRAYDIFALTDEESASYFLYMAADTARLAQDWAKAKELYTLFLEKYPHSSRIDMVKFLNFWVNYKQCNWEESKVVLTEIINNSHELSYSHQRASYWLARVLEKLGEKESSADLICMLATKFPASYYGSLAASRSKKQKISCKNDELQSVDSYRFYGEAMLSETNWIVAAMTINDVKLLSDVLESTAKIIEKKGEEIDRLTASYAAKYVNNHLLAANLIKSISNFSSTSQDYFKLHYTIAFEEEILPHCDFYDVPPIFVFSIARQESLFDKSAISNSYAIGILQLLPSTAQILANSENYGKITPQILQKPLTNIRFGVKFLSNLLKKFNGSIPLAAASYNAGPVRISKWIENNPHQEIDEFIEDIPIFQTRNYVKKVMTNYAVYNYIFYKKAYDELNFDLPQNWLGCFEITNKFNKL